MNFRTYSTLPGRLLALVCIAVPVSGLSAAALAQTAAQTVNPAAPADAKTGTATPPAFRSAFEGYQPYTDEKMLDWKQANDQVGQIGGWREYAKEASRADAPDSPSPGSVLPAQPPNTDSKARGAQAEPEIKSVKP